VYNGTNAGRTVAISRDGSMMAFASSGGGNIRRIHVRAINEVTARPLGGTDGGGQLAFSPDGQWIAFIADQQLKRVATAGGPVTVLAEPGQAFGVDWGAGDQIVLSNGKQLLVMSGSGGVLRVFAETDSTTAATLRWPHLLSDGKSVVFTWWSGGLTSAKIATTTLASVGGTSGIDRLDLDGTSTVGFIDGQLLYTTANAALFAVPFDDKSLEVTGRAQLVVDRVYVSGQGNGNVALSASGSLVFQSGSANSSLVLVDTMGAARPLLAEMKAYTQPRYSPDGKLVAVAITASTSTDVHVYSVGSGTLTRLTTEGVVNDRPEWTPDGKRVLYRRELENDLALWSQSVDFNSPAEVLLRAPNRNVWEGVIAPDGNTLVYRTGTIGSANIFWKRLAGPDTTSRPIATTAFTEWSARVSPDGKWVAYSSDESRLMQVYVRSARGRTADADQRRRWLGATLVAGWAKDFLHEQPAAAGREPAHRADIRGDPAEETVRRRLH
jgi:eukaryotic-like serine/threonine-protein kinase